MADHLSQRPERVARILTYVLPAVGGTIGIFWTNSTAHGSPIVGIGAGVFAGWIVALILSRFVLRGSAAGSLGASERRKGK